MDRRILMMNKFLWVGIGCQHGVRELDIDRAIEWVLTEHNLDLATIAGIATLDRKAKELELADYCRARGWFLKIYCPERLNSVKVVHPSTSITAIVGTKSVAEAAALCAAQTDLLLVPKQKFQLDSQSGWMTIAVCRDRKDHLLDR